MSKIANYFLHFISRFKYQIVIILGVLFVGFLDDNSFMSRIEYENQIEDLQSQIDDYDKQYKTDMQKIKTLKRDPSAISKIARERYFMKTDDEDIFVLSDDEKPANNDIDNETSE